MTSANLRDILYTLRWLIRWCNCSRAGRKKAVKTSRGRFARGERQTHPALIYIYSIIPFVIIHYYNSHQLMCGIYNARVDRGPHINAQKLSYPSGPSRAFYANDCVYKAPVSNSHRIATRASDFCAEPLYSGAAAYYIEQISLKSTLVKKK